MQVYMTEIDYHYFKLGVLSIGYLNKPNIGDTRKINILKEEVIEHIEESRVILRKLV